jgi:hypothetical protein
MSYRSCQRPFLRRHSSKRIAIFGQSAKHIHFEACTSKYAKRPFAGACGFRFRHSFKLDGEPDLGVLANERACYV